jgi:DNA-binding NtrC family response regulator
MARARACEKALVRLLGDAPLALYVLDEQQRIVYCNSACGELLGVDPDQLIGSACRYHAAPSGGAFTDIAACLCPPPEAFAGHRTAAWMPVLRASGEVQSCRAELFLVGGVEFQGGGLIVSLVPCDDPHGVPSDEMSEAAVLHDRLARLRRDWMAAWPLDELVGVSSAIQRVREQLTLAARGPARVLILGPAGSGREHAARLLHRRAMPEESELLIPLWCPLLDAELIQSTITDLVRRANASPPRNAGEGRAPGTRPPTLLLLEVDQLADDAQAELAGFLTLPGFELDTIATAQGSLIGLAGEDKFRSDLAYALSTLVIDIPPLAARPEDIPLLCQYFVEQRNAQGGRQLSGFTSEALDDLALYPWPENIEELADVVDRACQAAEGFWVESRHLPDVIRWANQSVAHPRRVEEPLVLDRLLADIEKELIERALRLAKGNKTKAARWLGLTRARFHRRLEHFEQQKQ